MHKDKVKLPASFYRDELHFISLTEEELGFLQQGEDVNSESTIEGAW